MSPMIVILLLVLVGGFALLLAFAGRDPKDYDERQRIVHGRAYMAAFWVFLLSTFGIAIAQMIAGTNWLGTLSILVVGMLLALTVHSVVCICGDAYEKRGVKQRTTAICMSLLILTYGVIVLIDDKPLYWDGELTSGGIYLIAGAAYVIILAAYGLKWLHSRRRGGEE